MKSGDFVAAYVYGQDGQRSNKYTANSETLYFNKMWTLHTDTGNAVKGGQYAKNIYLGETRIVTKQNSGFDPKYQEEYYKQYFYHSDHLGSASLISDYKGDEYQLLEYTPYGETWVEKTNNTNTEFLPYKFTGKEQDEETGLYYYGARYLDPKYSLWISTDPALQSYIPQGNSSQEDKAKEISQLPGMGGIFNHINSNLYHYAGNNPVRYVDPDGRASILQRTINDNETNKAYHYAHVIGANTGLRFVLHGLVDRGELGEFSKKNSVWQYSGSKSGFTTNDAGSKTDKYIIRYSGMDDVLTEKAVNTVLQSERFGSGDNEQAKRKYSIFKNDCNAFTREVLKEYKNE